MAEFNQAAWKKEFDSILSQIRGGSVTGDARRKLIERLRQMQAELPEGVTPGRRIPLDIFQDAARSAGYRAQAGQMAREMGANAPGGVGRPAPRFGLQQGQAGPYTRLGDAPTGARVTADIPAGGARSALPGGGGSTSTALARVGETSPALRLPGGGGGAAAMRGGGGGGGGGVIGALESAAGRGAAGGLREAAKRLAFKSWKPLAIAAGVGAAGLGLKALYDNYASGDNIPGDGGTLVPSDAFQKNKQQPVNKPAAVATPNKAYASQGNMSKAMGVTKNDDGKVDQNKIKVGQGYMFDLVRRIGEKGFDQPATERRGYKQGIPGRNDIIQMFRDSEYAKSMSDREINSAIEGFKADFAKQSFKGNSYAADRLPRGTNAPAGTVVPRRVIPTPEYNARYGR